jgi:hypothetical protein
MFTITMGDVTGDGYEKTQLRTLECDESTIRAMARLKAASDKMEGMGLWWDEYEDNRLTEEHAAVWPKEVRLPGSYKLARDAQGQFMWDPVKMDYVRTDEFVRSDEVGVDDFLSLLLHFANEGQTHPIVEVGCLPNFDADGSYGLLS